MKDIEEQNENDSSLVESTTIKTIRNLRLRNSYTKFPTGEQGDLIDNVNSQTEPQTPPQSLQGDDQLGLERSQNKQKLNLSRPSSQGLKNPMRGGIGGINGNRPKILKQQSSETTDDVFQGNGKDNRKDTIGYGVRSHSMAASERIIENPQQQQQQNYEIGVIKEQENINMEYAVQFVITKSKTIQEKLETEGIPDSFINQCIIKNKFFEISYNSYLQKMIKAKQINANFRNVSKRSFEKLEVFFMARIQKCIDGARLEQSYKQQSKIVYSTLDKKIQELKNELSNNNKIML